jgi:hypothetical protein
MDGMEDKLPSAAEGLYTSSIFLISSTGAVLPILYETRYWPVHCYGHTEFE